MSTCNYYEDVVFCFSYSLRLFVQIFIFFFRMVRTSIVNLFFSQSKEMIKNIPKILKFALGGFTFPPKPNIPRNSEKFMNA